MSTVLTNFTHLFRAHRAARRRRHLVMLDAVGESVRAVPLGAAVDVGAGLRAMVDAGGTLFVLGAALRRTGARGDDDRQRRPRGAHARRPVDQRALGGLPIQIAIGLVALVATLGFVATWMTGWGRSSTRRSAARCTPSSRAEARPRLPTAIRRSPKPRRRSGATTRPTRGASRAVRSSTPPPCSSPRRWPSTPPRRPWARRCAT
jgi:hypothetical protein